MKVRIFQKEDSYTGNPVNAMFLEKHLQYPRRTLCHRHVDVIEIPTPVGCSSSLSLTKARELN